MKKTILILCLSIATSVFILSCENKKSETEQSHTHAAGVQYTCPMHPEVISNKPGTCPQCGMDLVEKKQDHMEMKHDSTMHGDSAMKM